MSKDRLWERTQERIKDGGVRRKGYKDMLREFAGEGGIALRRDEKLRLFEIARTNPDLRMAILRAEQERFKMKPNQIPKTLIHDLQRLQATEGAEPIQGQETAE